MRFLLALLLLTAVAHAEVPASRLQTLGRGVNIDHAPFEQPWDIELWSEHMAMIRNAGFRHVRIFVLDEYLNSNLAVDANAKIARLDAVVRAAFQHRLAVILCIYPYKHRLDNPASAETTQYWLAAERMLAEYYRRTSPEQMFFELVNEPGMDGDHWWPFQEQLRSAVRQIVPNHTLILTSSPLDATWSLGNLHLPQDNNIVFTVHLYQPMVFSHQGASWDGLPYGNVKGLIWPPDSSNVQSIMRQPVVAANSEAMRELAQYERQGGTIMNREISDGQRWVQQHHVPMMVTEFGALETAPTASRAAWLGAARRQIEANGWGWTVWQYYGSFGIKADLQKGCDALTLALGLCQESDRKQP